MHAPSPEVRWLRFSVRHPREGERRFINTDGRFYVYEDGDWAPERKVRHAKDQSRVEAAVAMSSQLKKKYDAAPEWQDLIDRFGEQGVVRNERGKIVQYNYPKSDDPEVNRKVAAEVYDLWEPHRRISTDIGLEESAKHEPVLLKDPETGQTFSTHPAMAEKRARKRGLKEVRKRRTRKRGGS
mgnify:FL=1